MTLVSVASLLASVLAAPAADYTVQMVVDTTYFTFYFNPASQTIAPGDSVTWVNNSSTIHTSTSGDGSTGTPDGLWDSGGVGVSSSYTLDGTATTTLGPGTYPYYCFYHYIYGMTGSLSISNAVVNTPPSITLTNPADGAKYLAPATVTLAADASNGTGNITNVQFFSGADMVGSAASVPFDLTLSNLVAANYSFTSIALDDVGLSATSAVVNVSVLTNALLTAPTLLTNGLFQFTVLGISNQTYATEASSDLVNWSAISTNVAPADTFDVVDPSSTNITPRFYRVRQDLF